MLDWLGNPLSEGCSVLYSSKSKYVGIVLGTLLEANDKVIKIKPSAYSGSRNAPTKILVLHRGDGAYTSVTRYYGAEE